MRDARDEWKDVALERGKDLVVAGRLGRRRRGEARPQLLGGGSEHEGPWVAREPVDEQVDRPVSELTHLFGVEGQRRIAHGFDLTAVISRVLPRAASDGAPGSPSRRLPEWS